VLRSLIGAVTIAAGTTLAHAAPLPPDGTTVTVRLRANVPYMDGDREVPRWWEVTVNRNGSLQGHVNGAVFSLARLPVDELQRIRGLAECMIAAPAPALPMPAHMDPLPPVYWLDVTVGSSHRVVSLDTQGRDLAVAHAWPTLMLTSELCRVVGRSVAAECRNWLGPYLARLPPEPTCAAGSNPE
jgi:hypothetical protein